MYLPGSINERIGDLRTQRGWQQKELAAMIGISASQLSRIESGETTNINADTIAKLAKEFRVSADYILGLTTVSAPKNHEIGELGLSTGAVKALVSGAVDVQILNRLMEHKSFPLLIRLIKFYFDDERIAGVLARNDVINLATASIEDFVKENPEHKTEALADMRFLNAERLGDHEADIEKIKNTFIVILRGVKQSIGTEVIAEPTITATMMREIKSQLPDVPAEKLSADQVAAAVTQMVAMTGALDEETAEMLQTVISKILEQHNQ